MFFIGTSGWVYNHWQGNFYPENLPQKEWLKFYASHFKTVEVNATFYHSMKPEIFLNWRKVVGNNFVFSIKGNRFITHIKRLKNCKNEVERFFEGVEKLPPESSTFQVPPRQRRGPSTWKVKHKNIILWQLPPGLKVDINKFKEFLAILPKNWRRAFEFRNKTWLCREIYGLLKKANAALVIQDSPDWPSEEVITADFTYLRFHGKEELYSSCYSQRELENWAKKMVKWNKEGIDVYAYFNNDAMGYAVENAKCLIKLLKNL